MKKGDKYNPERKGGGKRVQEGRKVASAFDKGLFGTITKKLEASPSQGNDLALSVFSVFHVRLDVPIRDFPDHQHKVFGFRNIGDQPLVLRFQ